MTSPSKIDVTPNGETNLFFSCTLEYVGRVSMTFVALMIGQVCCAPTVQPAAGDHPNIVLIMVEDI